MKSLFFRNKKVIIRSRGIIPSIPTLILKVYDMQTHQIITKKNGQDVAIGALNLFTKYDTSLSVDNIIDRFLNEIPHSESIGYAGFGEQQYLKDSLLYNISDPNQDPSLVSTFNIPEKELIATVEQALQLCHEHIETPPTNIFLFPTLSAFVQEKMGGVSGYTPYKNTLLLFVSPTETEHWKRALTETICHEFLHTVMDNFYERQNLLDDLVFEGVAESFVSFLFGERPDMPSQALSQGDALEWYRKLREHFQETDIYYPVFLEGKDYPLWAGYAVGYRLVEAYRKRYPETSWNEIVRLKPEEILAGSDFRE